MAGVSDDSGMSTSGFWAWWESRTGQIVGWTLFLVPQILLRLVDLHGTVHDIVVIIGTAVSLPAAVLAGTGYFRRKLRVEADDVRQYPTGRDEKARREAWQRLRFVRTQLVFTCLLTAALVAGVASFVVLAIIPDDSQYVGGAIALSPLALIFGSLTVLAFRARRRYGGQDATEKSDAEVR